MGDAGFILGGPVLREILSFGTIMFAVCSTGGQLLAGQIALSSLSDNKLCLMLYTGIFAIPTLLCALPRTFGRLSWLSIPGVISILVAGLVGMIGAGISFPLAPYATVITSDFTTAFISVTNPVFGFAGHFMFFMFISEMKHPTQAMRAAWVLQGFATTFYIAFAVVLYIYVGDSVTSPAFTSLPIQWQKAAYAIALPNFLICGSLNSHTAAKLLFVRIFRKSKHLHSNTVVGWGIGIAASLFASWYTYGIAGAFW